MFRLVAVVTLLLVACSCAFAERNYRFASNVDVVTSNPPRNPNNRLNIAAWNLFKFGSQDVDDGDTRDVIIETLRDYDVVFVQEIVDDNAFADLLEELRDDDPSSDWRAQLSPNWSPYAQAYLYKRDRVRLTGFFFFGVDVSSITSGTVSDWGRGPPFVARFESTDTGYEFIVIGSHLDSSDVKDEIDQLADAYATASAFWNIDDVILYGDYNADCNSEFTTICDTDLYQRPFVWLLSKSTQTKGKCKLDRIVVTEEMFPNVNNTGVFDFKDAFSLSNDEALDVSDHEPVWVQISDEGSLRSSFDPSEAKRKCDPYSSSSDSGLEGWEIALIVVGVLLFLVIVALLIVFLVMKRGGGGDKYKTQVYRSENVESI